LDDKVTKKMRIDIMMVERGLAESRTKAQLLVMGGQVRVNGQLVPKPSVKFSEEVLIEVEHGPRYVSRGGEKLEAALCEFNIDVTDKVCADVGASTGGFTDCLIQHGAERVYAVDVGRGILHWKLRQEAKVVIMEGTNARSVKKLPEEIDLVTIDASFISLKVLLPVVSGWLRKLGGDSIALIKPQFEAGRAEASRGQGVIRDASIHKQVLFDVITFAENVGYQLVDLMRSPLLGPKGNVEFVAHLRFPAHGKEDLQKMLDSLFTPLP
jgi:23S rRNA (cytidine1920-2'-O)/16S rRNA (cytidine1409-2'-O)-methyltransferase